jgi:glycosyltransferase involved in cell wall biosynthesis
MANTWHLLSGEYPPDCGGVGDYTAALAKALAGAGDRVHVWTPAKAALNPVAEVTLHALPDSFGRASRHEMQQAWMALPGIVLLQYVPNALGARGANLPFCRWFSQLGRRIPDVRVMFHEPYFYFTWTQPLRASNALALVQRAMARLLLRGASRVYLSTETWTRYLKGADAGVALPIPSSIPVAGSEADIASVRKMATEGDLDAPLVGHFGTYGAHVGNELLTILPALVARTPAIRLALVGAGGPAFLARLARSHPDVARRAWAGGRLDPAAVASALCACDLLVQPYPDGITTRRTSVMAGLKNGVATVSTAGELTERVWKETDSVALAPAGNADAFAMRTATLLGDAPARAALGQRGRATYAARFSMHHTVAILRGARPS